MVFISSIHEEILCMTHPMFTFLQFELHDFVYDE